jgi:hypothetical protein
MFKIKVDVAVSRDADHGAVGAVCRDLTGNFYGVSARTIKGISDPATLESGDLIHGFFRGRDHD